MAKNFKAKPFKQWLDHLCAVVVKTRDDFTCQIQRPGCSGGMSPGDRNCQWCHIISRTANKTRWDLLNAVTGCGRCHQWAHANPAEFGLWFVNKYPHRWDHLCEIGQEPNKTWKQADFEEVERFLIGKSVDLNVDIATIRYDYRGRYKRKVKEYV